MMRGTRRHPGFLAALLLLGCHGKFVRPVSDDPIPATPERLARARNLAGDREPGLGRFDAAAIKQALRSGHRLDGRRMAAPMSTLTRHYSAMTDADLDAIVAFLESLPPARNRVPERKLAEVVGHAGGEHTMTAEPRG